MYEIIKKPKRPDVTVFVPFTRLWVLPKFFDSFDKIELTKRKTELAFYVDSNDGELVRQVRAYLASRRGFNGLKLYVSNNPPPTNTNIAIQRNRIVDMKENSKKMIDGDYVFGLEDDTIAPPDAFDKLYKTIYADEDIGFVQGVEAGRHGIKMVGVWKCDNIYKPAIMKTLEPKEGVEEIDGGGLFCYITLSYLYRELLYRWKHECFGPDVSYVMDLRRMLYKAYVDWSIKCTHIKETGQELEVDDKIISAEWRRNPKGRWVLQPFYNK